jgi:hypothetical protein
MSVPCLVCAAVPAATGALCVGCVGALGADDGLVPAAVGSGIVGGDAAWLVDRWGRLHAVADPMRVGRQTPDLSIAVASVSRAHATLRREGGAWVVRDGGSRNGTFVGERRVEADHPVRHGDRLRFGTAAFWFVERGVAPTHVRLADAATETLSVAATRSEPVRVPGERRLLLMEPSLGGGGLLVTDGLEVRLTLLQHALLRRLVDRNVADREQPATVRGFVPWTHLSVDLPWDSVDPDAAHLKRLVSRVRRLLEGSGLTIEARHGLGYRLWSAADSR